MTIVPEKVMKKRIPVLVVALMMWTASAAYAQTLARQGDRFTVDGVPKFLMFISYFDAMRRSDAAAGNSGDLDTDFRFLKSEGFDGIRIFPNWWSYSCSGDDSVNVHAADTLFTSGTGLRHGKWNLFIRVLDRAAAHGLLVDVSFSRETVAGLTSVANYQAQIATVASRLAGGHRHVFFDIQNEFDNSNSQQHLTEAEVLSIAKAIHEQDPLRLVTASTTAGNSAKAGSIVAHAGLDFAATHPPLGDNWSDDAVIAAAVNDTRGAMGSPPRPVHLQETTAFSNFCDTDEKNPDHHAAAAARAKANGAAGFTFHTRKTFDLSTSTYVQKLVEANGECRPAVVECTVVKKIGEAVADKP
jgi:hypothetical protein